MSLLISEGSLEIMQFLKQNDSANFKQLRELRNLRTKKMFSPNTISNRLKELRDYEAIEVVVASKDGRNTISYKLTNSGERALSIADRFEGELKQVLKKRTKD